MGIVELEPTPAATPVRHPAGPESAPQVVVHLIASNFFGGPEKQVIEHCSHLDPFRWRAVIGSFREGRDRVPVIEAGRDRGFPVFQIDTRSPWSPGAVGQLRRFLRAHSADLLVTHGYKATAVGVLARRFHRIPQIPYERGYTSETWKVRRYETLDRFLIRWAFPRVLCVSEHTRRLLIGKGVAAERLVSIHNAVRPPGGVAPAQLRQEFQIPGDAPILVAAGRLSGEKGHRFLVEAMSRLRDSPAPQLVILGEGRERDRLWSLARTLEVSHRVHLAGFRPDPLAYLAAADLVVNPSLTEGLPNVVLEAQSLGIPVVATDVGGVSEILEDRNTGWLAPPADPVALAAIIRSALLDRALARSIGDAGRARVEACFSFPRQAERLMAIYDEAVGI